MGIWSTRRPIYNRSVHRAVTRPVRRFHGGPSPDHGIHMRPSHIRIILNHELAGAGNGEHTPVMLWGPPGIGKSDLVRQAGERHRVPVVDIRLSQMEPSDLRGIPFRIGEHVEWAVPSMLPDAGRHGPSGFLFLDELTSAAPSVCAAAYQLILDRRLGDYRVPTGWAIVAAGNRQGDRGISYTMPSPLANRFSHYEITVDVEDWADWAYSQGIDERVIGFVRFRPDRLFHFDPADNPRAFPTPRSWEFVHRALRKYDRNASVLGPAIEGCVGQRAAVEFQAFLASREALPDIDRILVGERPAPPEELDLQYALACALISRAVGSADGAAPAGEVCGRILAYAGTLPQREIAIMLVSDLVRMAGDPVMALPEFAPWADTVADLLLYD